MTETLSLPYEIGYQLSSEWKTEITRTASGKEQRRGLWTNSRKGWVLSMKKNNANFKTLDAFIRARKGKYEAFNWTWANDLSNPVNFANAVRRILTVPSNLKACWLFDAWTGTTVQDYGSGSYPLTLSDDASTMTPTGKSLNFDSSKYFESVETADFSFRNSPFTVLAYINPTNLTNREILSIYDLTTGANVRSWRLPVGASQGLYLQLYTNSSGAWIRRQAETSLIGDIGSWHLYAGGSDGSTSINGLTVNRDSVRTDDTSASSGTFSSTESQVGRVRNCSVATNGTKTLITPATYGAAMIISEKLTPAQEFAILNLLQARFLSGNLHLTNSNTGGDGKQYLVRFDTDKPQFNMGHYGYADVQIPIVEVGS